MGLAPPTPAQPSVAQPAASRAPSRRALQRAARRNRRRQRRKGSGLHEQGLGAREISRRMHLRRVKRSRAISPALPCPGQAPAAPAQVSWIRTGLISSSGGSRGGRNARDIYREPRCMRYAGGRSRVAEVVTGLPRSATKGGMSPDAPHDCPAPLLLALGSSRPSVGRRGRFSDVSGPVRQAVRQDLELCRAVRGNGAGASSRHPVGVDRRREAGYGSH